MQKQTAVKAASEKEVCDTRKRKILGYYFKNVPLKINEDDADFLISFIEKWQVNLPKFM